MPNPRAPSSIANLRDIFSRNEKDKIPPDLNHALTLLNLTDLAGLEERFLATTAFLAPWAAFRDSCLLVHNSRAAELSEITRLDILWFYTQFDEGVRRHDPRTEKPSAYFEIDKREWGIAEFEKHLYVWMLQAFCVGKASNPFGFQYFTLRNVCTAWEAVFVPIVKAVRASYSVKGRIHYGRLALFIEERCPSRLAFPEGNITMPDGVVTSPTPFRMMSRPTHLRGASQAVLTNKNYDEAEKELRNVYPQYGGLVERPRFKQKMDEWLEEQRVRATHRKAIAKPDVVQYVPKYQPQVVHQSHNGGQGSSPTKSPTKDMQSRSPIKRYSDSIRRSIGRFGKSEPQSPLSQTRSKTSDTPKVPMIPYGLCSYVPKLVKEEPKSPLHGVTRQIYIPDDVIKQPSVPSYSNDTTSQKRRDRDEIWPLPAPRLPRPELPKQWASERSVYSSIRGSNPFSEDEHDGVGGTLRRQSAESDDDVWSPMGALSAIPRPLKDIRDKIEEPFPETLLLAKKSYTDARHPSYEGNGYQEEINLTNLHTRNISTGSRSIASDKTPSKPRSRLPAPIKVPPPFIGQLRVASNDTYRKDAPPKSKVVPGESPPKPVPWPGFEDSPPRPSKAASAYAPPIPAKSPERLASKRHHRSEQLLQEETGSHDVMRIVSKENIRAALGDRSPESSVEDLRAMTTTKAPMRVASPPRLATYNTHMFPRKDTQPGGSSL